jgi:hypothetical protein
MEVEEMLREESRLRILLTQADARYSRLTNLDEVYRAARREDFSTRMTTLAAELYRISTALILLPESDEGTGDFTTRQIDLMRRALRRLGLESDDVEILEYPRSR